MLPVLCFDTETEVSVQSLAYTQTQKRGKVNCKKHQKNFYITLEVASISEPLIISFLSIVKHILKIEPNDKFSLSSK